jgi:transposase-like protein
MIEGDVPGLGPPEYCPACGSGHVSSCSTDDDDAQQVVNRFACKDCSHAWVVLVNFADGNSETRTLQ